MHFKCSHAYNVLIQMETSNPSTATTVTVDTSVVKVDGRAKTTESAVELIPTEIQMVPEEGKHDCKGHFLLILWLRKTGIMLLTPLSLKKNRKEKCAQSWVQ